ncbi:methylmalonyl-CoA mutase [Bacillus suaedae]|nr:methylmalonyl-CoA mutase [Bacillus suaedae]
MDIDFSKMEFSDLQLSTPPSNEAEATERFFFTEKDVKELTHLDYVSGIPPFLRGPYPAMYKARPWTIRQYSGFSTAEESNAFYKKNVAAGQKGLSVAFDLATHRGYDSDHPDVASDVGKAGVAIDTVEDMIRLFHGIPLDHMSVSMTMNGAILPIMAFYIVAAEEQGVSLKKLSGTIQNDILKEYLVRNTYIYPPKAALKITSDILKYNSEQIPKFHNVSISGYHMQEAGATPDLELAYTLCNGIEYIKTGLEAGLTIDEFAPRLSFFWGIGMNHFEEVAKLRAARLLWATLIKPFQPKNETSMSLRAHSQTSGWSLTAQDPYNNLIRTTIEAIAAVLGHTQSLHTNAFDEALALPSEYSARLARETQLYVQKETGLTNVVDPLGGSYYLENLTAKLVEDALEHIRQIEQVGGMIHAIQQGIPQKRIEEASARRQARIDSKQETIIGVTNYQLEKEMEVDLRSISEEVRKRQIASLNIVKKKRNQTDVEHYLKALTECAQTGKGNLLEIAIEAARARATLGEISMAYEKVVGRFKEPITYVKGVYKEEFQSMNEVEKMKRGMDQFTRKLKRTPSILLAKMGQDGHDRGIKVLGSAFNDLGFDVHMSSLFQTPKEIANQAVQKQVDIVGFSSLAGGHKQLTSQLMEEIQKIKENQLIVIVGGIIPTEDIPFLTDLGVAAVFGPGTVIPEAAKEIMKILLENHRLEKETSNKG